jgi:hypothetical protein
MNGMQGKGEILNAASPKLGKTHACKGKKQLNCFVFYKLMGADDMS